METEKYFFKWSRSGFNLDLIICSDLPIKLANFPKRVLKRISGNVLIYKCCKFAWSLGDLNESDTVTNKNTSS